MKAKLVLTRISTMTMRNDEVEIPAGLVAVYCRVYCPGKQAPSVNDRAVHLSIKNSRERFDFINCILAMSSQGFAPN